MFPFQYVLYYSLSYHYGRATGHREEAFRYSVEAGDECIDRGAYADAIIFIQKSATLVKTLLEAQVIIAVVDKAIEQLRPSNLVTSILKTLSQLRKLNSMFNGTNDPLSETLLNSNGSNEDAELLLIFSEIKSRFEDALPDLEKDTLLDNDNDTMVKGGKKVFWIAFFGLGCCGSNNHAEQANE